MKVILLYTSRFILSKTLLHTLYTPHRLCVCRCRSLSQSLFVPHSTAPQQSPEKFLNITVSRTHQNTGLVIQWTLTLPLPPGTSLTHYQLQYRKATGEGEKGEGEGAGEMVEVESDQRWAFVDGLDDARSYEVCIHVYIYMYIYTCIYTCI